MNDAAAIWKSAVDAMPAQWMAHASGQAAGQSRPG